MGKQPPQPGQSWAADRRILSQERLKDIFQSAPDAVFLVLAEGQNAGRIVAANRAAERMHGYAAGELLDKTIMDLDAPEAADQAPERMQQLAAGETLTFEIHHRRKDGSRFPVEVTANRIMIDGRGYILAFDRDITARKVAEEKLRQFNMAAEHAMQGVSRLSVDGRFVEVQAPYAHMLGYEPEQLIGESWAITVPEEDHAAAEAATAHMLENGRAEVECRACRKNGSLFHKQLLLVKSFDAQGLHDGHYCFMRDISERKKMEQALRQSEEQFRALVESAPVPIFLVRDGRMTYGNHATVHHLGFEDQTSVVDTPIAEIVAPDYLPTVRSRLDRPDQGLDIAPIEVLFTRRDGEPLWVILTSVSMQINGEPTSLVVGQDITRRKLAEDERARLQAQLRHSQKMDAVGQLAAGVAHEFNNVLVGIVANAELLTATQNQLPDQSRQALLDIHRAGLRAADLTKQLLTFARKRSPNVTVFDVNQLLSRSQGMLQRMLGDQILLEFNLVDKPTPIRADESELENALINLSVNARDAMPGGGKLQVLTEVVTLDAAAARPPSEPGEFVRIRFVDNGCGMSPDVQERVFEPFFTTKPVGKGTGLGLSTVFADVTKSGGFITVHSGPGVGTDIQICLPLSQVGPSTPSPDRVPQPSSGVDGETILICDDDELALTSLCALLRAFDYDVIPAANAHEAIQAAARYPGKIALLLTDISMPEMDGVELAETLTSIHPDLKVLYTSGYGEDVLQTLDGRERFIQKPVPGDVLTRRIRDALDKQ